MEISFLVVLQAGLVSPEASLGPADGCFRAVLLLGLFFSVCAFLISLCGGVCCYRTPSKWMSI